MKNMSIKAKLLLIVISTIVLISIVITMQSINNLKQLSDDNIKKYKTEAYQTKQKELKQYVSMVYKTVESYHERTSKLNIQKEVEVYLKAQSNFMFSIIQDQYETYKDTDTNEQIKQRIKQLVKSSRYGKNGYFWINDFDTVIVMHPFKKALIGKSKKGVAHWDKFVEEGKRGEGFVSYTQKSKGKLLPKISYVKTFKPFNWIIGTGTYIDDITKNMKKEALKTISEMRYGKNGYFWVNDMDDNMIMHPVKKELIGKNFTNSKKVPFVSLGTDAIKKSTSKNEMIKYSFYNPSTGKNGIKISNVSLFKPWNWVIGTGAYVDDIEKNILAMSASAKEKINNIIIQTLISASLLSLFIIIIISFISTKYIIEPIRSFEQGLLIFFKYLNKESSEVVHLDDSSKDEIGVMSKIVNENIIKTKSLIDQDAKLIEEVEDVLEKVNNGFYMYQVKGNTQNQGVESLKNTLNNMIKNTNEKISILVSSLVEYGESNFEYEIPKRSDMNGSFGSLVASTKLIGNNVSELIAMIMNSGDKLDNDTSILSTASKNLAISSNEQASSLEETAAALEEITATIQNNTVNIGKMTSMTDHLTKSAKSGMDLASKTTVSMQNINDEVTAIDEAILVIDQIAFQTNILSLNAAVEAATAGEAGKGFAVVAQEVRNLASRSADAANEIKALVQSATLKANQGKEIAQEMIDGYNSLSQKINNTSDIVHEVQIASQEQEHGIVQINDAVTQLDQATQQNASTASQISDLSIEVANLSSNLVTAASRAKFNKRTKNQVCDVDLVFNTAKLKNSHIIFKTNNFNKLGENKQWTVVNHHECALGKWIEEQERNNTEFTKSDNWIKLKDEHSKVHVGVQNYIDEDAKNAINSTLVKISSDIENATVNVFELLNHVKIEHCKS